MATKIWLLVGVAWSVGTGAAGNLMCRSLQVSADYAPLEIAFAAAPQGVRNLRTGGLAGWILATLDRRGREPYIDPFLSTD